MPIRVDVHPADSGGCGYSRLRWPAQALADDPALDITISPDLSCEREAGLLGDMPVRVFSDADVIVFQRPMRRELVEAIPILQRQGTACVVEIDDDFHSLPTGHPARRHFAPMHQPDRNWRWLARACDLADLVTTSTPALAQRYGAHGRVVVLPNCVPEAYLSIDVERSEQTTITWTGTPTTHIGDLEATGRAVRDVMREIGAGFRAVGSAKTLDVLGVDGTVVGWSPLTDFGPGGYAAAIAAADVGIVPLADNLFNQSKSAIKGMEYAALGVPFVASPLPDYVRMHVESGIGVLAKHEQSWRFLLRELVTDGARRCELAAAGRAAMAAWTYQRRAHLWGEAWEQALIIRRGKKAAA